MRKYAICSACIMDTTDPDIEFDENGICNHCLNFEKLKNGYLHTGHRQGDTVPANTATHIQDSYTRFESQFTDDKFYLEFCILCKYIFQVFGCM